MILEQSGVLVHKAVYSELAKGTRSATFQQNVRRKFGRG